MKVLETVNLTPAEIEAFENECFRSWLNRVDAKILYDERRDLGSVATWRKAFDLGQSENEAIEDLKCARDNRAYCNI